jgi:hypothetical protein
MFLDAGGKNVPGFFSRLKVMIMPLKIVFQRKERSDEAWRQPFLKWWEDIHGMFHWEKLWSHAAVVCVCDIHVHLSLSVVELHVC